MMILDSRAILALTIAAIAVVTDVRGGRIPNALTFGGALVALGYGWATDGLQGFGMSAAGWLAGAALFFPFFALGGMGAGDVKLLAAMGAWLGPAESVWIAMYAAAAGGALALVLA